MTDLLFIAMTIAFFALAAGFVRVCDRIIGPDDEVLPAEVAPALEGTALEEAAP